MQFDQSEHHISIDTPLGKDVLLVQRITASESMSGLFEYHVTVLSQNDNIKPADLVGCNVTLKLKRDDGGDRYFNGFVNSLTGGHKSVRDLRSYQLVMVPWTWFLTKNWDCRIFQNKTVKDIIQEVFDSLGFTDYKLSGIQGSHPKRDYCVQYRESDFNFVSRLMEEEGIFYFFEHEDKKHTMVLADDKSAYQTCKESSVEFNPSNSEEGTVKSWDHQHVYRTGKWAQNDYNFTMPSTPMMSNTSTLVDLPQVSSYEVYDYPGSYQIKSDGDFLTKIRMEEEEAGHDQVVARTSCRSFFPGGTFKITEHEHDGEDAKEYIITSVEHQIIDTAYLPEEQGDDDVEDYYNIITCIPKSVVYRAPTRARKPQIHSTQTAVVVGPGGEEIYTDKYSRIKVQFHWDRLGKKDENSSCWVRVSQPWAGKKWGMISIPRIGQEVVVSFLEGDPDRPLVVGSVYNEEQMPPYELPANKTQSGWKSRSSKGGGPDNFNEIRFEDKKGEEELYVHAEKDKSEIVENDKTVDVGHDLTETIGNNKTMQITANHSESIGANMQITVGGSLTESVAINYAETVGAAMELTVGGVYAETIGAQKTETVGGNKTETIGNNRSETVGGNRSVTVSDNATETVKKNRTLSVEKDKTENVKGKSDITIDKELTVNAKKIQLTAKDEIAFKTGSAMITMKKNGDITIKGKKITVKGSGDVTIKGSKIKEN